MWASSSGKVQISGNLNWTLHWCSDFSLMVREQLAHSSTEQEMGLNGAV